MYKAFLAMITLLVLTGPAISQTADVEYFPGGEPGGRVVPFSDAVRVGNLLFLSGKLGTAEGDLAPGGIAGQTRQALENIKASLERHGSSMDRVVKCTVFLADMAEWDQMNEVYVTFFGDNLPARSAIGTSGLALGGRVEIECIGVIAG
jgi:reactive intermediate/imine deaminase